MSPMPQLFFLIAVLVCAGATNMVFVKAHGSARLRPIDGGVLLRDGKRLFGDNKTWKGFFGMIAITAVWLAIAVWLASHVPAIRSVNRGRIRFPPEATRCAIASEAGPDACATAIRRASGPSSG